MILIERIAQEIVGQLGGLSIKLLQGQAGGTGGPNPGGIGRSGRPRSVDSACASRSARTVSSLRPTPAFAIPAKDHG
jgi:hypothetical protein